MALMTVVSTSAHVGWLYLLFSGFALEGLAMGYAIHQFIYLYALRFLANKRYSYRWSKGVLRLLLVALLAFLCAALLRNYLAGFAYWSGALLLIIGAAGFSVVELYSRMCTHPKLVALVRLLPRSLQKRLAAQILEERT
jgi:hypothetical protein